MKRPVLHSFVRLALAFLFGVLRTGAQAEDTSAQIFDPDFKTLKVEVEDDFMSAPCIPLDGDRKIVVSFDELTTEHSYLCYSLYHCNADWRPSQLMEVEYLKGFNKADVDDYGISRTTYRQYVNYRITIPNEDMRPLVSGNYLLKVYREDDPDETLLQTRFSLSEEIVPVSAKASVNPEFVTDTPHQQLEIELDTKSLPKIDPFSEILVVVEQNGVPASRVQTTNPLRVTSEKVIYGHSKDLLFPSGNEWRRFETVRADYPGMHTDSTRYVGGFYQAYLTPDEGRAESPYAYDRTQFGRFKIREYNSTDSDLGADYVGVHFTLDFPQLMNADVYLDGEFTNHLLLPEYKLTYDPETHLHKGAVALKQGSYNYRYLAVARDEDGNPKGPGHPELVEGDKKETVNEYRIQVFVREHGARADRLVSDTIITTAL